MPTKTFAATPGTYVGFGKLFLGFGAKFSSPPAAQERSAMERMLGVPARSARAPHWDGLGRERVLREVQGGPGRAVLRTAHVPEYLLFALAREMELRDENVELVVPADDARAPWEKHIFAALRVELSQSWPAAASANYAATALAEAAKRLDAQLALLEDLLVDAAAP